MQQKLQGPAIMLALALLGGVGLATAQTPPSGNAPGAGAAQEKFNLNRSKEQSVQQGLNREQPQSVPGYQGQVGSKVPDSANAKQLPGEVTAQVPEIKELYFVKLPDRILLMDPQTRLVAEIVMTDGATTGGPANTTPGAGAPPR
jgi:hypothetical protein